MLSMPGNGRTSRRKAIRRPMLRHGMAWRTSTSNILAKNQGVRAMLARHALPESGLEDYGLENRTSPDMSALTVVPFMPCRSQMHPAVFKLVLLCWILLLAIFWVTFAMSANALFMVAIGTVYATVFFGVPYLMNRIGGFSGTSSI